MKWLVAAAVVLAAVLALVPVPTRADCFGRSRAVVVHQKAVAVKHYGGYNVAPAVDYYESPYYYSVGAAYREEALTEALKLIRELSLRVAPAPQQGAPQTPAPVQPVQPPADHGGAAKDYQDAALLAVVQRSCARCHTGGAMKGNDLALVTPDGKLAPLTEVQASRAYRDVLSKRMPPTSAGNPVSDEETGAFFRWAEAMRE